MIAAADHQYDLAFTGTLPQSSRIHYPTATGTDLLVLSIFMGRPQRVEVYRKGIGFVLAPILRKNTHFRRKKSFTDSFDVWHTYEVDQGKNFGG